VAYVTHFKVILLVWVFTIATADGSLWGNMREYAGRGNVCTGADVEMISVWAWLYGVMVQ